MSGVSRRRLLTGGGLALAAVGLGGADMAGARSRAAVVMAACDPALETFGTATSTATVLGSTMYDGHLYAGTRGQTPALVADIDLATMKLSRTIALSGEGAWGATTAGDRVYAGTYPVPDLFRIDPATGKATKIGTIGGQGGMVWCMTTTPNGKVYAGQYPGGEVWGHDPRTGDLWKLAKASDEAKYVRAIAADDTYVYAGTLPDKRVVAIDRRDGSRRDITPGGAGQYGGIGMLLARDGRVYGVIGAHVIDMKPDGSDLRVVEVPGDADRGLTVLTITADGTLYCAGTAGIVYRRTGDALEKVATPVPWETVQGLFEFDAGHLVGAGGGFVWSLDIGSGEPAVLDLYEAGLAGPDKVQSVAHGPSGLVHVGGTSVITTHRAGTDEKPRRTVVHGEPKQLRVVDGRVYAALYPSTELVAMDAESGEVMSYGFIGNDQLRPTDMKYVEDRDLLVVSTAPATSDLTGALALVQRPGHDLKVHVGVIPDQAVSSVAVEGGIAYLSGDTAGGGSGTPTKTSASVAAFDLETEKVLWEVQPYEDHASLKHIAVHDGVLYGLYKVPAGKWFTMDVATQRVLASGALDHYGEVITHRGHVFAHIHSGKVYALGPGLSEPKLLADGLGTGWYNAPQLAFVPDQWQAWIQTDKLLARVSLDPACTR